jgi:SAM-dependent methyltransferase
MSHDKIIEYLHEFFDASLPRLNPGDGRYTRKVLEMLRAARSKRGGESPPKELRILDIGCGNGASTLELAEHVDGTILAVDYHQPYLDELMRRAEARGVSGKIRPLTKDMRDMGLEPGSFDLIWSEGALFVMGFREGVAMCRSLVAPGGAVAASELSWLRPDPPAECRNFFADLYPRMADVASNLKTVRDCGYEVVGHFVLPESIWWESFFHPLEARMNSYQEMYAEDPDRLAFTDIMRMERDQYRKYSDYYGSVFYLMLPDDAPGI